MSRACSLIGGNSVVGGGPGNAGPPSIGDSDIDNVLTAELSLWHGGVAQQGFTNTLQSFGSGLGTSQSSAASGTKSDSTGLYTLFRSVAPAFAGFFTTSNLPWTTAEALPDYAWVLKTGVNVADITNVRIWLWLTSEIFPAGFTDTDSGAANVLGFRFSTVAGDLSWQSFTSDPAGAFTVKDTGVLLIPDTRYVLRCHVIQMLPTPIVQFSIVSSAEHPGTRSSILDVVDLKTAHDTLDKFPAVGTGLTMMFAYTKQVGTGDIWFRTFSLRNL